MKRVIIVNPHSSGGRTGASWGGMESMFRESLDNPVIEFTDGPGAATRITKTYLKKGFHHIIAVGGDGTVSETVNGFFENDRPVKKNAILSFVMNGTGCDYAKSFGISREIRGALNGILNHPVKSVDIGRIECMGESGEKMIRYFNNVASFGMGGEVAAGVNDLKIGRLINGRMLFYLVSVYMSLKCGIRSGAVRINRGPLMGRRFRNISIAIGKYHGGGMKIAPLAEMDDGLFDVITVGDFGFVELLTLTSDVYRGTHINRSKVISERCTEFYAQSDRPVRIEVDGEVFGMLPARFTILRSALRVRV
jgi:YegS/Rv2252/BmrU family lipid kinase